MDSSDIRAQNLEEGSLAKLKTQLSLYTAELDQLGDTEANAARRATLQETIRATSDELKKQEEILGDHHRSVGDYAKATVSLRQELRNLTQSLAEMAPAGDKGSEAN